MNPPDENALLLQAVSLARSGRKEDAQALLQKIVADNPHLEMAWLWLVQTEPDPARQILILEDCLRNNPKSEYAKRGLAGLRVQMQARPTLPPIKPPSAKDSESRKPKKPSRGSSGIWKIIFVVLLLALVATLVAGGFLLFPLVKNKLPKIHLPIFPHGTNTPKVAITFTPSAPSLTATATFSATPTVTRTRTITFTPSLTRTPTISPTPTLFLGTPTEGEESIYYTIGNGCTAAVVPISGGPHALTTAPQEPCYYGKISPDATKISYLDAVGELILYTKNIDGSGSKKVLDFSKGNVGKTRIYWWNWSPDGKQFASESLGTAGDNLDFIYLVASNGTGSVSHLKQGGIEADFTGSAFWSPDSQWIFLWDWNKQDSISYPTAIRVSDSRNITLTNLDDFLALSSFTAFSWTPDSKYVSFVYPKKPDKAAAATEVPNDQPFLVGLGVDKTITYLPLPAVNGNYDVSFGAKWSPDGSRFILMSASDHQLIVIGSDGKIQNRLINLKSYVGLVPLGIVQWSPDGQWISIVEADRETDTIGRLEIVRPDGSDFRILANDVGFQPVVWK